MQQYVCLVTLHGIGFQQAPVDSAGILGYADRLHVHLSQCLDASLLGDDPQRQRTSRGTCGPIYVQSHWPPETRASDPGLARLGTWDPVDLLTVERSQAPLNDGGSRIAHVALVYSHLEDQGPRLGSLAELSGKVAFSLGHYSSIVGAARLAFRDLTTAIASQAAPDRETSTSLQVRAEAFQPPPPVAADGPQASAMLPEPLPRGGLLTTLRQLEDDVATYVCRNDLRERVRSFVRDALLRLICRSDVAGIVINAHSQGTVVAFDVLRELPLFAASKVRGFITAGSPLRKYTDLFCWGSEVGNMHAMGPWMNFWDPRDPVGDPLAPPAAWRPGTSLPPISDGSTLYEWLDPTSGAVSMVPVDDQQVDNVTNSKGGGLQAHNYWDNELQVVQPLAEFLRKVAAE